MTLLFLIACNMNKCSCVRKNTNVRSFFYVLVGFVLIQKPQQNDCKTIHKTELINALFGGNKQAPSAIKTDHKSIRVTFLWAGSFFLFSLFFRVVFSFFFPLLYFRQLSFIRSILLFALIIRLCVSIRIRKRNILRLLCISFQFGIIAIPFEDYRLDSTTMYRLSQSNVCFAYTKYFAKRWNDKSHFHWFELNTWWMLLPIVDSIEDS